MALFDMLHAHAGVSAIVQNCKVHSRSLALIVLQHFAHVIFFMGMHAACEEIELSYSVHEHKLPIYTHRFVRWDAPRVWNVSKMAQIEGVQSWS